jgi:hypothetical protein
VKPTATLVTDGTEVSLKSGSSLRKAVEESLTPENITK